MSEVIEMLGPDDEQIRNIKADVQLKAATDQTDSTMTVTGFTAELPRADLTGSIHLEFGDQWQGDIDLSVVTRSRSPQRLRQFASTEWLWESGEAVASFSGDTLAALIESARGEADIQGVYRGRKEIPISLQAQISDRQGRIGADLITLTLGSSAWTGAIVVAGASRKTLSADAH